MTPQACPGCDASLPSPPPRMCPSCGFEPYERHPYSAVWPDMAQDVFADLVEDVKKHGVREPIVLFDGQVLDGWHRYRAACKARVAPSYVELQAHADPAAVVISANAHRRNIKATPRIAAMTLLEGLASAGGGGNGSHPVTHAEIAAQTMSSRSLVRMVRQRIRGGHGEALATGRETLSTLTKKERVKLAKRDTVTTPLTRMEKVIAENEELRARIGAMETEIARLRELLAGANVSRAPA